MKICRISVFFESQKLLSIFVDLLFFKGQKIEIHSSLKMIILIKKSMRVEIELSSEINFWSLFVNFLCQFKEISRLRFGILISFFASLIFRKIDFFLCEIFLRFSFLTLDNKMVWRESKLRESILWGWADFLDW